MLISIKVEGSSLLPSDKIEQYANFSTSHLMIWLELLTKDENTSLGEHVNLEDLKVFAYIIIKQEYFSIYIKIISYIHIYSRFTTIEHANNPTNSKTERGRKREINYYISE